jgi:hypothetical protein
VVGGSIPSREIVSLLDKEEEEEEEEEEEVYKWP